MILTSLVILLVLSGITINSNLESMIQTSVEESVGLLPSHYPSDSSYFEPIEIEMAEIPDENAPEIPEQQRSVTSDVAAAERELAKWKAVELLKV